MWLHSRAVCSCVPASLSHPGAECHLNFEAGNLRSACLQATRAYLHKEDDVEAALARAGALTAQPPASRGSVGTALAGAEQARGGGHYFECISTPSVEWLS